MVNIINSIRLKDIRKDNDIKQEEMAEYINIKRDAYSKYETGVALPNIEVVFNFSKYFGLSIDYVLGLTNKRIKTNYEKFDKKLTANNLKQLRLNKGLSQSGLARKLNITQSAIHRYENLLSNPSLNIIYKYCKLFNITFDEICSKKVK